MTDDAPDAPLPYSAVMIKALVRAQRLCTYTEHRVLQAYAAYADVKGIAWPSVKQLADDTGLATAHVSAAIASLLRPVPPTRGRPGRLPLLETVVAGGGAGQSARRRLLVDGDRTITESVNVSDTSSTPPSKAPKLAGFCANPHRIRKQTVTESVKVNGEENSHGIRSETLTDFGANSHRIRNETITESVRGRGQEEVKEEGSEDVLRGDRETRDAPPAATTGKAKPKPPEDDTPIFLTFPCNGTPEVWHLRESLVEEFQGLFPPVDVKREALAALAWVKANRKKTASGMRRYLTGWFTRANNTSTSRGSYGSKTNGLGYFSRKPPIQSDGIGLDAITVRAS